MKISKKAVEACGNCDDKKIVENEEVCDDQELCDELGVVDTPNSKAINHIKHAIDSLAEVAKEDESAREAIANLSVVLFDLK